MEHLHRIEIDVEGCIPETWTLLDAVVVAKYLDEEGNLVLAHRATPSLKTWEAVGMLISASDDVRDMLRGVYVCYPED